MPFRSPHFVMQPDPKSDRPSGAPAALPRALDLRGRWSRRDLLLLALCPLILIAVAYATERWRLRGYVMPGVELGAVSVAGLSREALRDELATRSRRLQTRVLTWSVADVHFRLSPEELAATIEIETNVERVMRAGRSGSVFEQAWWRVQRWFSVERLPLEVRYDERRWDEQLTGYERAVLQVPREGELRFEDEQLVRIEPQAGQVIDRARAHQRLRAALLDAAEASEPQAVLLPLTLIPFEPKTTHAAVTQAETIAKRLLMGPITLEVELPPEASPELTERAESERIERLDAAELGPALETRPDPGDPSRLEMLLDAAALEPSLQPLRTRWEQQARDAAFTLAPARRGEPLRVEITPSQRATRIDAAELALELLRAGQSPERRATLRVHAAEQPRITTQLASSLGITREVASFTSKYACCQPRVQNIHRIAALMDGVVVLPGEVFSINQHVGPRVASNGFLPAPTIVKGEIEDTVGGGVSQFATAIYNAVFNAGYEIIERQPHSYYFSRYPVGHEATLSFPKPDFIFRNDTPAGLLIKTEVGSTFVRVRLFGDNQGRSVQRKVSAPFDTTEPPIEYVIDDSLSPDEAKLEERGQQGFSVMVSRVLTHADGTKRVEERKVIYQPRVRIVRVHSCKVPEGAPGHTGEECPEPELDGGVPALEEP